MLSLKCYIKKYISLSHLLLVYYGLHVNTDDSIIVVAQAVALSLSF